ncbi:hypothetical protein B9Z55_010198 [Caenorhabditis nigoni]|uniref:DNA-directed RNA polymerase n=1 Tax=Caenorhabditis nigoni TaxID=1611254 RepID=A0A2G5UES6_9PELO|nr:hypothetical protein B9Z55_010198 [Caenorhabditis nigoni]
MRSKLSAGLVWKIRHVLHLQCGLTCSLEEVEEERRRQWDRDHWYFALYQARNPYHDRLPCFGIRFGSCILGHIIYDFEDPEMMEMVKPSLDEAFVFRLDLAGPLLAFLFRALFRNLLKEMRMTAQKYINKNDDFALDVCVKTSTITRGLAYSLATGNWGDQKKAHQSRRWCLSSTQSAHLHCYAFSFASCQLPIGREGSLLNLVNCTTLNGEWCVLLRLQKDRLSAW